MSGRDDDSQERFALGFLFALIALVVLAVVGGAVYKFGIARVPTAAAVAPATTVAVVTETVAVVIPDGASIQVGDGVVSFYFATGSADLAPGAAQALAAVIQGVEGGRRAMISGFHDATGDAAVNEALARQRAEMVRDVLVGLDVPADRIELRKPAVTTGTGSDAQARRVEVTLVD